MNTNNGSTPSVRRWGSIPMVEKYSGPADGAFGFLPTFDKLPPEDLRLGANTNFDLVVRRPDSTSKNPAPIPVGMVSKTYRVIQHSEVLASALEFVRKVPNSQVGDVKIHATENGERIMFEMMLGASYTTSPDGHEMGLRLVCRNSVDGTSAVRSHLGWFRFVCSNGMVVGVTLGKSRITHKVGADLIELFAPLTKQVAVLGREQATLARWTSRRVSESTIRRWVDGPVAKKWNSLSAARVWHICQTGADVRFIPPFEKLKPSLRKVEPISIVPGSPARAETIYDLAQALSYVASRRHDIEEAELFQRDIGPLLDRIREN